MATDLRGRAAGHQGAPDRERGPVAALALRLAIPAAVIGLLLLIKPEIVRGTFSSAQSIIRVGAVTVAWIGFSFLLRRFVTNPWLRTGIVSVAGAALLWATVAPYFIDETVDDAFPVAAGAAPAPVTPAPSGADPVAVPGSDSPAPVAAGETPPASVPAPSTDPVKLSTGQFRGLAGHQGSGEAAIYQQADGTRFVRLEEFSVSNGPGLTLYLVPGANRESPGSGAVNLGNLRGNRGNQNFGIPAGSETDGDVTILIWCQPFAVPMAAATQGPA